MKQEFWGTLSIQDHIDPIFIKSLILFDRIVVPVPNEPFANQSQEEFDILRTDCKYLEDNDAAIIYEWDSTKFQEYQRDYIRESLSIQKSDNYYDTRLMLADQNIVAVPSEVELLSSVPVYGAKQEFQSSYNALVRVEETEELMLSIGQLLNSPIDGTPLEEIVRLRNKESFKSAKEKLVQWQLKTLPETITEKSTQRIQTSINEFEKYLIKYNQEIESSISKKKKESIFLFAGIGTMLTMNPAFSLSFFFKAVAGSAKSYYSFKELISPNWKKAKDKYFEPAGVVFEANKILKASR
jgi:hypothetical protein